jgi:hypothetical protein
MRANVLRTMVVRKLNMKQMRKLQRRAKVKAILMLFYWTVTARLKVVALLLMFPKWRLRLLLAM